MKSLLRAAMYAVVLALVVSMAGEAYGGNILFVENSSGRPAVYIMDETGANQKRIRNGIDPQFSPDGEKVAFITTDEASGEKQLAISSLEGEVLRTVDIKAEAQADEAHKPLGITGLKWSTSGEKIAFTSTYLFAQSSRTLIAIYDIENKEAQMKTMIETPDKTLAVFSPALAWTEDDQTLLFAPGAYTQQGYGVFALSVNSDEEVRKIAQTGKNPVYVSGSKVLVHNGQSLSLIDISSGKELKSLDTKMKLFVEPFKLTKNGELMLWGARLEDKKPYLTFLDPHTLKVKREFPLGDIRPFTLDISPDGKKILYTATVVHKDGADQSPSYGYFIQQIGPEGLVGKPEALKSYPSTREGNFLVRMFMGRSGFVRW